MDWVTLPLSSLSRRGTGAFVVVVVVTGGVAGGVAVGMSSAGAVASATGSPAGGTMRSAWATPALRRAAAARTAIFMMRSGPETGGRA